MLMVTETARALALPCVDILRTVRSLRRFTGVLTQALLIHMLMLGGGAGCSRATTQSSRAHEHQHAGSSAGLTAGDRVASETHAHERCDAPCTPAGCAAASTHCSSSAPATPARALDAPLVSRVAMAPASETAPPSVLSGPDTPPPRA